MSSDNNCMGGGHFAAMLSFVAFLVYSAAVASPKWIEQAFNTTSEPPIPSFPPLKIKVVSNIGLLWACTDRTVLLAAVPPSFEKCQSLADTDADLVKDWQWIAAGFGVAALVFSFVGIIMSCCFARRGQRGVCPRVSAAILYLLAGGLLVASLVLFVENMEFDGPPKIDYDYAWGFYMGAVSAGLFFVMAILCACGACRMSASNGNELV